MNSSNDKMAQDLADAALAFLKGVGVLVLVSSVIWVMYTLAAPFWHLPGANFFEVFGTLGLLAEIRNQVIKIKHALFP